MIYSLDKGMYTAVLLGEKTLTTRLRLPAHIAVGKEWAMVPKRAAPAWWLDGGDAQIITNVNRWFSALLPAHIERMKAEGLRYGVDYLKYLGFVQARIRIEAFYQVALADMTEREARDEGVESVEAYARLWDAINPKVLWADHRDLPVWRIRIRLPDVVASAVSRIGRAAILAAAYGLAVSS